MHDLVRGKRIVLFDGVCNLCNGSVMFILHRERTPEFKFASIQSETGKQLLAWCGLPADYSEEVILIDNGKFDSGSSAALKIGQTLRFPWDFLSYAGFFVPGFIRDWVYHQVAKHRYQWFGKRDVCMAPAKELQSRFYG